MPIEIESFPAQSLELFKESIPLVRGIDPNMVKMILSLLDSNSILSFLGVSAHWRGYFLPHLRRLFQAYPVKRSFVELSTNSAIPGTFTVSFTDNKSAHYHLNLFIRYRHGQLTSNQLKCISDGPTQLRKLDAKERLGIILDLEKKEVEQENLYVQDTSNRFLATIPDQSLLSVSHLLRIIWQDKTANRYNVFEFSVPLLRLKWLLYEGELANYCRVNPAFAYFVVNDIWLRDHLPEKELKTPSRASQAWDRISFNFLVMILGGAAALIATSLTVFLMEVPALFVIAWFFSPIWGGIISAALNTGLLYLYYLCFAPPPFPTIKTVADLYKNMAYSINEQQREKPELLTQEIQALKTSLADEKNRLLSEAPGFSLFNRRIKKAVQLKVLDDQLTQLEDVNTASTFGLYKEKTKIRSILIGKKEQLVLENPQALFSMPRLTRKKIKVLNKSIEELDEVKDFNGLVTFEANLLSKERLVTQRHFGVGYCDTYKRITSIYQG